MNLTEFLLARIAEDERACHNEATLRHGDPYWLSDEQSSFELRVTPARVLTECEAKRRIVERHQQVQPEDVSYCGEDGEDAACPTLRLLALPYADHPDYDPAWRP